jgi:hypothetical protein
MRLSRKVEERSYAMRRCNVQHRGLPDQATIDCRQEDEDSTTGVVEVGMNYEQSVDDEN